MYQTPDILAERRAIGIPARAQETLFIKGEPSSCLFEVRRGVARAVHYSAEGDRQVMAFFFPGDVLGLPLTRRHRYSAEAASDMIFTRLPARNCQPGKSFPATRDTTVSRAIWQEEKSFMTRGLIIGRVGYLARVAAFVNYVAKHLPMTDETLEFPIPRGDIASYLATSPETICRTLRQLREMQIIAMPRLDRLQVKDPSRLAQIAGGPSPISEKRVSA